jgi:hypothetical protein
VTYVTLPSPASVGEHVPATKREERIREKEKKEALSLCQWRVGPK